MNMYRCKKSTVPSDCDVDDDPIGPVKEKSRDIADFNIFDRDQEYNPFRIWKIQVQKKKNWVKKWMEKSAMRGGKRLCILLLSFLNISKKLLNTKYTFDYKLKS